MGLTYPQAPNRSSVSGNRCPNGEHRAHPRPAASNGGSSEDCLGGIERHGSAVRPRHRGVQLPWCQSSLHVCDPHDLRKPDNFLLAQKVQGVTNSASAPQNRESFGAGWITIPTRSVPTGSKHTIGGALAGQCFRTRRAP